jgi:hypothetical protein
MARGPPKTSTVSNGGPVFALPAAVAAEVYAVRWEIEMLFRELKTQLRLDHMPSGKRPLPSMLHASLLALALNRNLRRDLASHSDATFPNVGRSSFALSLQGAPKHVAPGLIVLALATGLTLQVLHLVGRPKSDAESARALLETVVCVRPVICADPDAGTGNDCISCVQGAECVVRVHRLLLRKNARRASRQSVIRAIA